MGQMLLAIALALFVAQGLSAYLIWREQHERHLAGMVNSTAMRMLGERMAMRHGFSEGMHPPGPPPGFPPGSPPPDLQPLPALPGGLPPEERLRLPRTLRFHVDSRSPEQPGDIHMAEMEKHLRQVLESQGEQVKAVLVVERDPARDALVGPVLPALRARFDTSTGEGYPRLVIASMQQADGTWMTVRSFVPSNETLLLIALLRQTILIYLVLVGVVALILRRITRPLRALTGRLEQFAREPGRIEPLVPQGPEDMKHLIAAHNAMEARISALLDEKDVMLGAIGHDLKTPLAALRVRIEAVEDDTERARMAATIEDINRSLDDILSLARVGRPSDPVEATEISALVVDIIGEYEDMGEPVEVIDLERMVAPVRATWLRRALRNLVSNSLRYGERARVTLARDGHEAVITVDDDGPGIPEGSIALMMEPFTRLDPSRNSATGGTGLGLTLARAIADQHGGSLILANRIEKGRVVGLRATLRVPLA
ncbi:ATP-binding protein [Novosphingobium nitrogenifigens]